MISQKKRMMHYTYFNRAPSRAMSTTHLFALHKHSFSLMVCTPFPTITVDIISPDFVGGWSASCRTKINKANLDDLKVDRSKKGLEDVMNLFQLTARRKGLRGSSSEDLATFPKVEISALYKDGEILCGHIWVIDEEERRALLYVNASKHSRMKEDASLIGRAHYFLLWQDGLFLHQNGVDKLDLMGYREANPDPQLKGVYQWKAATHGTSEVLYHYYPIWFYVLRKFRNMLTR